MMSDQHSTVSTGSDPIKVASLFEKIEKSHNIEIEERSLKNLSQKLQHKLIDPSFLALHYSLQIPCLLEWITRRLGECSSQGLFNCLTIFKFLSLKQEGKNLLRQIRAHDLFSELTQRLQDPNQLSELEIIMKNLFSVELSSTNIDDNCQNTKTNMSYNQTQMTQGNIFNKNLMKSTSQQSNTFALSQSIQYNPSSSQFNLNQIPEREEDPSFQYEEESKSQYSQEPSQYMQSQAQKTTFSKKEFQIAATNQKFYPQVSTYTQQTTSGIQTSQLVIAHKEQQLKEPCELPYITLNEDDEKSLFDLSVQLKFGDFKNILNATQKLNNQIFFDFPVEVFLQRTDIFRALIDLLEGTQGNVFTNLAQPTLITFVQRLKTLYPYMCSNVNKVSHLMQNERDQKIPMDQYLELCYPNNHNGRWLLQDSIVDTKKYGYALGMQIKQSNLTAAALANSLSCKSALAILLVKSIYLLKDSEKIGLYIQLINESLDALYHIFKVQGNPEFSEILHLCLFSFDSVCAFYNEQIFTEVLIQPVLHLMLRFIEMLNCIPKTEDKHQEPFSEYLYENTKNFQRILRRALFSNYFGEGSQPQVDVMFTFFQRLESELIDINLLQRNVQESFKKAQSCYDRFNFVTTYKINASGLIQNEQSGIIFIETMNQYYQSLQLLEELSLIVEMKIDFPFEHLLVDCIMYGVLAEESNVDPKFETLEKLLQTYLQIPIPEIRERLLRKIYQKLRIQNQLSVGRKAISNTTLLAKFLFRKQVLNQLINGVLINLDIANQETKLQMNIGTLIVKILILAHHEGGFISQKNNLNTHFLTFHSLLRAYPDTIGLIELIEENAQKSKSFRIHRLIRDLFSYDPTKREFATQVLNNNFSKDIENLSIRDMLKETIDLRNPVFEVQSELELINSMYDSSALDINNILGLLMNSTSDFVIKKSCIDQLTLILFDFQGRRGKYLFKNTSGIQDLFQYLIKEIVATFQTCQGYLRHQVSLLDISQVQYLNECLKFVFYTAILYQDEQQVKQFFSKIKSFYLPKEKPDPELAIQEQFLNAIVFYLGSNLLRKNALRLLFVSMFNSVLLGSKQQKVNLPNGQTKKNLVIVIPDFTMRAFISIIPYFEQELKQPQREDLLLTEEQKTYIITKLTHQDNFAKEKALLMEISANFNKKVSDKNENYNAVMKNLDVLVNYVIALSSMRDELINNDVVNGMVELLKVLPTKEFEYSFLADYFMIINQLLISHKRYPEKVNLKLLVSRICEILKVNLIPYLIESTYSNLKEVMEQPATSQQQQQLPFNPKLHFVQRFLELVNTLIQVDLYMINTLKMPSCALSTIITDHFLKFYIELYQMMKNQCDNKRKIMVFISQLITYYDIKHMNASQIPELFINTIATQKLNLLFQENSITMLAIRTLIQIQQRRMIVIQKASAMNPRNDVEVSVSLTQTTMKHLQKYQSFGWIVRFIECRDSRVRCLAWDLITELFDYDFLKNNPSIVSSGLNTFMKHQELYSVKISALKFLNKACDALIYNCDISKETFENSEFNEEQFVGSLSEQVTVQSLIQQIAKQGLISNVHQMFGQKDAPLLFITLTLRLLHKLVQMDHKKALPVMTQLDYWTFLVDMINIDQLREQEMHENRVILEKYKENLLKLDNPTEFSDMIYLSLNSIIEFIFEAFKRDAQLANLLVKTTKLMAQVFEVLKYTVEGYNQKTLKLMNPTLLIVFFDKIVKLMHVSLFHPKEYSADLLKKFFFDRPLSTSDQHQPRNWIYINSMFVIINELSKSCYIYGQVEVKLSICRFIAEFLLRTDVNEKNYLDEMVSKFDGQRYLQDHEWDELDTYGSLIFVEMGMVFRELYMEKNKQPLRNYNQGDNDNENQRIDICMCISALLCYSKSAKTASLEQNLIKKVIEICQENINVLYISEIQKMGNKTSASIMQQKSVLGKSTIMNNSMQAQSLFESQMKRSCKYADITDTEACQREILRMLQILKHLFYNSQQILALQLSSIKQKKVLHQSKMSTNNLNAKKVIQPVEESIGEKLMMLWNQIYEQLDNFEQYSEIIHETYLTALTMASQGSRIKNLFTLNIPMSGQQNKKQSFLKTINDKIISENLQSNTIRLRQYFTILRSLSTSPEIARYLMQFKTIEELQSKIQNVCKKEKDIKVARHYISYFIQFLAAFAYTEDGQKMLLKMKDLIDFLMFILDTVSLQSTQSEENKALLNIIIYNLLFFRNSAYNRTTKLHFLANPSFLPCLLAFISSQSDSHKIKAYTVACLWVILYNHQQIKGVLNKEEIINELELARQDYQRYCDIGAYSHFIEPEVQHNDRNNYVVKNGNEEAESLKDKKLQLFILKGLNGILTLLQQN